MYQCISYYQRFNASTVEVPEPKETTKTEVVSSTAVTSSFTSSDYPRSKSHEVYEDDERVVESPDQPDPKSPDTKQTNNPKLREGTTTTSIAASLGMAVTSASGEQLTMVSG